jgi:uncharacterized protein (TIGR00255 family)
MPFKKAWFGYMLKSMTGFGRQKETIGEKIYTFEIKSVNSKALDLTVKCSRALMPLEEKVRQKVSSYISRGKVDVYFSVESLSSDGTSLSLNKDFVSSYISILNEIKDTYGVKGEITLDMISKRGEILLVRSADTDENEEMAKTWAELEKVVSDGMEQFIAMRAVEGENLKKDLISRLNTISEIRDRIEEYAPVALQAAKERVRERINKLLDGVTVDENRLLTECAILADKTDISEEFVRLSSHINQVRENLNADKPIGRTIDHVIQEMNREVNTIGSKANSLEILNLVVEAKGEIEKIREQIQNIE